MTREQLRVSLAARGFVCLPPVLADVAPRLWLSRPVALRLVGEATGLSREALLGPGKTSALFRGRALFFLLARELGRPVSDTQFGRELGGRDRTTITNLARRAETFRATDADFTADFLALLDRAALHLIGQNPSQSGETSDASH